MTRRSSETRRFGENLAKHLRPGGVLLLEGNLGSGKTTLVKGLAKGLKITTKIKSPSFTLFSRHRLGSSSPRRYFYHFDLYRLKNKSELSEIGFDEIIGNPRNVVAIEWPEKIGRWKNQGVWRLELAHGKRRSERLIKWHV